MLNTLLRRLVPQSQYSPLICSGQNASFVQQSIRKGLPSKTCTTVRPRHATHQNKTTIDKSLPYLAMRWRSMGARSRQLLAACHVSRKAVATLPCWKGGATSLAFAFLLSTYQGLDKFDRRTCNTSNATHARGTIPRFQKQASSGHATGHRTTWSVLRHAGVYITHEIKKAKPIPFL